MNSRLVFFLLLTITLFSCNKEKFYIYSDNKSYCITVITDKNSKTRYIIQGRHNTVPDSNYVKISTNNIDTIGDEIVGCWNYKDYEWVLLNDNAIIIENKLDTLRYKFSPVFPIIEEVPSLAEFIENENCFDIGLDYGTPSRTRGNIVVER